MKKTLLALALAGLGTMAQASTVVTFDDLVFDDLEADSSPTPPPGYGGVVDWSYSFVGIDGGGDPSLSNMAPQDDSPIGTGPGSLTINFIAPVIFEGVDYHPFGGINEHSYHLYYQGGLVFEGEPTVGDGLSEYWLSSGYSGFVDRIVFHGAAFTDWEVASGVQIDNLTYTMAPVPEPGSYAMLLLGLGVTGALARRQKRLASR